MANEHEDKAPKAAPKTAEPKAPAPTQAELDESYEGLVVKLEKLGHRDDPDVAKARDLLDRKPDAKKA
jgi:hypothetical protein